MLLDSITGCLTMDSFHEEAMSLLRNSKNEYLIMSLNLDNFKNLTLSYGYQNGNVLLHDFTSFFHSSIEHVALSCRQDADHFLFLIDRTNMTTSVLFNQLDELEARFIQYVQEKYPLSRSGFHVGLYFIPLGGLDLGIYIEKAERAEHSVHTSNNNIYEIYSDQLDYHITSEAHILSIFEHVAEEKRLVVYLQPKLDISNKELIGAEALVRIRDIDGSILFPSSFIPILEKHGLIYKLDLMVLESCLQILKNWFYSNIPLVPLSVNLSKYDFYSEDFLKIATEMLDMYNIPKKYIVFEVSEDFFEKENDFLSSKIEQFHSEGYTFHMDNFGQNDASIFTMGMLPIDAIKINKNMLINNLHSPKGRSILIKLFHMFQDIGLKVICEGVESTEDANILKQCGCHYVQGYLYDKPLTVDRFHKKYLAYHQFIV